MGSLRTASSFGSFKAGCTSATGAPLTHRQSGSWVSQSANSSLWGHGCLLYLRLLWACLSLFCPFNDAFVGTSTPHGMITIWNVTPPPWCLGVWRWVIRLPGSPRRDKSRMPWGVIWLWGSLWTTFSFFSCAAPLSGLLSLLLRESLLRLRLSSLRLLSLLLDLG